MFLLLVGLVLALATIATVMLVPLLPAGGADGAMLESTYDQFRETGRLSVPEGASTGVYALAAAAGWLTGDPSPYPGLRVAQALLTALPLLWLPTGIARIFRRARSGYALVLLPAVGWLLNNGTVLVGTPYGLYDGAQRVSSYEGLGASMTFLVLSVLVTLSTFRQRRSHMVLTAVAITMLAGLCNLFEAWGGAGAALGVGILWALRPATSTRRKAAAQGALVALLSVGVSSALSIAISASLQLNPATTAAAAEPADVYLVRLLSTVKESGALIGFIVVGMVIAFSRRAPQRWSLGVALAITSPALVIGLASAVLGGGTLSDRAQLYAVLGLLSAVALGALVWSITSMPSHVRAVERSRLSTRSARSHARTLLRPSHSAGLSVVVPTRNGADVIGATLESLAGRLGRHDEIIVVENGSSDATTAVLAELEHTWRHSCALTVRHSSPGLGEALREGVLASSRGRLLLSADDLPFGFSDLEAFRRLPESTPVAVGSKAHPESRVSRSRMRMIQSRIFRFLRGALLQSRVGDSQGTLWVDGAWGREFAHLSRESSLMWTTELILAAEQQHIEVVEVPVTLNERHETGSSRFRVADAWRSVVGFSRLAVYKDDYCNEEWVRSTHATTAE